MHRLREIQNKRSKKRWKITEGSAEQLSGEVRPSQDGNLKNRNNKPRRCTTIKSRDKKDSNNWERILFDTQSTYRTTLAKILSR